MLDQLRKEDFDPHVQKPFRLTLGDALIEAELVEARAARSNEEEQKRQPFSLLFWSVNEEHLPQGI